MYIKITNGNPTLYKIRQLRSDNPQVSFSKEPTDAILAEYDVYPVTVMPKPEYDSRTHYLKQSDFYQVEGKWYIDFVVIDKPQEEIDEINEQLRAEAYRNESDPLFFKYQRGELDKQEWLDKVAEIKQRY